MEKKVIQLLADQLSISQTILDRLIKAFAEGNTVPFIARYRKEMTGGLDEQVLFDVQSGLEAIHQLLKRKEFILATLAEQGVEDAKLLKQIKECYNTQQLEDLYAPYKKKRKTKASVARELGLEPLAKIIMGQYSRDINADIRRFVRGKVTSVEQAISGAKDIITEWVADDPKTKDYLRESYKKHAILSSKKTKIEHPEKEKYRDYFDFSERLAKCPSHRYLAILRGENQKILKLKLSIDDDRAKDRIENRYVKSASLSGEIVIESIAQAYSKYMCPSIENQIKSYYKQEADKAAIIVFQQNLEHLLLASPLKGVNVLAIDPGFRSGCKVACVDLRGSLLAHSVIYPHAPQSQSLEAGRQIASQVKKYNIKAIAIGNGTASRETKQFIDSLKLEQVEAYVISESGASIYSASEVAREEFPDLDLTVRGAISLARRLQDPLSELVKLDPKSIGVGQYQHDVDATKLKRSLDQTVLSCVNKVGVNLNTASSYILNYIAGLGSTLAHNIVKYRKEIGGFSKISQLKAVPRLGPKAYEQSAGFLRITDGKDPLDNTGIHPEAYTKLRSILKGASLHLDKVLGNKEKLDEIKLSEYVDDVFGIESLNDIKKELLRPGHDPRGKASVFAFDDSIKKIDDLVEGMLLPGIVSNVTNFGAFVDIGIKENGLLHISQIADRYLKSAAEVLKVEQKLIVKITSIDLDRARVGLSLKDGGKIL